MNPSWWAVTATIIAFYRPVGVTENERPIIAAQTARVLARRDFMLNTDYRSGGLS